MGSWLARFCDVQLLNVRDEIIDIKGSSYGNQAEF
jgi:hypothetical protein